VKKGPWTAEEDKKLINFILTNGQCCWRAVPKLAGLRRCGKSCRLRWTNYLRPDLKRGLLTEAEEQLVIDLHARLGNRFFMFHNLSHTNMHCLLFQNNSYITTLFTTMIIFINQKLKIILNNFNMNIVSLFINLIHVELAKWSSL